MVRDSSALPTHAPRPECVQVRRARASSSQPGAPARAGGAAQPTSARESAAASLRCTHRHYCKLRRRTGSLGPSTALGGSAATRAILSPVPRAISRSDRAPRAWRGATVRRHAPPPGLVIIGRLAAVYRARPAWWGWTQDDDGHAAGVRVRRVAAVYRAASISYTWRNELVYTGAGPSLLSCKSGRDQQRRKEIAEASSDPATEPQVRVLRPVRCAAGREPTNGCSRSPLSSRMRGDGRVGDAAAAAGPSPR